MPDNQHLRNLKKQRELIEGHLAWINEEIAKETSEAPTPSSRLHQSSTKDDSPTLQQSNAIPDVLEQLGPDMKSATNDTKKGCFIYFGIGVAILAGIVTYIYTAY